MWKIHFPSISLAKYSCSLLVIVGGAIVAVFELLVVQRRRRLLLRGVVVVVEGWGLGRTVGARDVGLGLGVGAGVGLCRRLGVGDERHGPARVMKQLAQGLVLLE